MNEAVNWLQSHGLVDAEVDVDRVRVHSDGLGTLYLRLVRKRALVFGHQVWVASAELEADRALLAHELVHVGQFARLGRLRFIFKYLRDLLLAGFRYSEGLPLELPAYDRQREAATLAEDSHSW